MIKEINGARICIVGQAFPRTANANPPEFFPDWSFGLREPDMIELVENIREDENPDAIVNDLRPGVLVIVPLGSDEFYGLCDRVGGDPAGRVVTGEGTAGFEWCFVK